PDPCHSHDHRRQAGTGKSPDDTHQDPRHPSTHRSPSTPPDPAPTSRLEMGRSIQTALASGPEPARLTSQYLTISSSERSHRGKEPPELPKRTRPDPRPGELNAPSKPNHGHRPISSMRHDTQKLDRWFRAKAKGRFPVCDLSTNGDIGWHFACPRCLVGVGASTIQ